MKCYVCGNEFQPRRSDSTCCSGECQRKRETIVRTLKNQEKLIEELKSVKCKECDMLFTPSKYRKDQLYCGSQCLNKAMYSNAKENSQYKDNKQKYDKEYRELNKDSKRKRDLEYKDRLRFDGNGSKAMERDGYKCTECGKTNRRALIVHHKDHSGSSDKPNNDLSNLITLCRSCHMNHHSSKDPNHIMYHRRRNKKVD